MIRKRTRRDTQNVTIRLTEGERETAKQLGGSVNAGLVFALGLSDAISAAGLAELRGYFKPHEWRFLASTTMAAVPRTPLAATSVDDLCRVISNSKNKKAGAILYGVDVSAFCKKLRDNLSAVHVYAIWMRIKDYVLHEEEVEMKEWAEF